MEFYLEISMNIALIILELNKKPGNYTIERLKTENFG